MDSARGLPFFGLVGLLDTAVNEVKDRVRAAIKTTTRWFARHKRRMSVSCD